MPSIYDLKPAFQTLLRPLVRRLAGAGITANQVTVLAMLISLATGGLLYLHLPYHRVLLLVPAVLFVRMALNAIDGMLAREHHMQSALGGFLNELGDVISDSALYLPFALLHAVHGALVVCFVLMAVISEMTGVIAAMLGTGRRYDGPLGKSDRAFTIGALALLLGGGVAPGAWLNVLFIALNVLLLVTIYNRVRNGLKQLGP